VLLNIKVTVSSIIEKQMIAGNSYPVATSRVYNAPVEVNDGYTVAIGGLDEAKEKTTDKGVPLLGRVPVLGYLFKSKGREKNHKNLMLFITPTLIDPRGGGLPDEPQSVVRQRPAHLMPQKPSIRCRRIACRRSGRSPQLRRLSDPRMRRHPDHD